jgi:hypothetical protein
MTPVLRLASRRAPESGLSWMMRCINRRIGSFGNQAFSELSSAYGNVRLVPEICSMKYLMILPVLVMLILEQKRVVQVATRRLRKAS